MRCLMNIGLLAHRGTACRAPTLVRAKHLSPIPLILLLALVTGSCGAQQETHQSIVQSPSAPRLAASVLDVTPPSARVEGSPGNMRIIERSCHAAAPADIRRRIVNTAVQEWAFFGFQVDAQSVDPDPAGNAGTAANMPRRFLPLLPEEVAQVATTVGGYWAAIPGSDWILKRQNDAWQQDAGLSSRWRDPWSAAFISWVMCESGLSDSQQFQRAIAHHTYIDQAIRAQDSNDTVAAYLAYSPGAAEISPGDLLCNGLRPMYRTLDERRKQLGEGARTHCDIVVRVNTDAGQILTIGGNVRASVRMKMYPAGIAPGGMHVAPLPTRRPVFAHLKLQTPAVEADAVLNTPTLQQLGCTLPSPPVTFAQVNLTVPFITPC